MLGTDGGIPNFQGGQVLLSTGDIEVLKVDLSSTHIDINLMDKAFIKRIIAMRDQLTPKLLGASSAESAANLPQIGGALSTARQFAEALCSRGITITVCYKNRKIATIGAEANPILLHRITKTRGIAINSVFTAIRIVI